MSGQRPKARTAGKQQRESAQSGSNAADGSGQIDADLLAMDALPGELWAVVLSKCSWRDAWPQVRLLLLARPGAGRHLQGRADLLSELIAAQGPNFDCCPEQWPLRRPSWCGRADVLALLLQDHTWPQEALASALDAAVWGRQPHIVQQLLDSGLVERGSIKGAVELAATRGETAMLKLLLEYRPEDHSCHRYALFRACINGHLAAVELLNRAVLGQQDRLDSLLISAAEHNKTQVIKLLISYGANVNAQGGRVLGCAALWGYDEVVEVLLDAGANVDGGWNRNPLYCAVSCGHKSTVRLLLAHGAEVNGENASALCRAAWKGNLELTRLLVEHGARLPAGRAQAILQEQEDKGQHEIATLLRGTCAGVGAT